MMPLTFYFLSWSGAHISLFVLPLAARAPSCSTVCFSLRREPPFYQTYGPPISRTSGGGAIYAVIATVVHIAALFAMNMRRWWTYGVPAAGSRIQSQ